MYGILWTSERLAVESLPSYGTAYDPSVGSPEGHSFERDIVQLNPWKGALHLESSAPVSRSFYPVWSSPVLGQITQALRCPVSNEDHNTCATTLLGDERDVKLVRIKVRMRRETSVTIIRNQETF